MQVRDGVVCLTANFCSGVRNQTDFLAEKRDDVSVTERILSVSMTSKRAQHKTKLKVFGTKLVCLLPSMLAMLATIETGIVRLTSSSVT